MKISKRRPFAAAALLLWSGVVGWHVKREYFKPAAMRLAEGARSLAPGSYYYLVRMNGAAIGFARSRFDTLSTGFVFEDNIILDVPALDTVHRAIAATRIELGPSLQLRKFSFDLTSEIGRFNVVGVMRADTMLDLELRAGGRAEKSTMRADRLLMLDAAVPLRLAAGNLLQVWKTISTRVFDPSTMSDRESILTITA